MGDVSIRDVTYPDTCHLPGYGCQMNEDAVKHSREKLESALVSFQQSTKIGEDVHVELKASTYDETINYRCIAKFQIISSEGGMMYAMRNNFQPVGIGHDVFPVANVRIQKAMFVLKKHLDSLELDSIVNSGLTGVEFVTSWDEGQLVVTLIYDKPLEEMAWRDAISDFIRVNDDWLFVAARSRGQHIVVHSPKYEGQNYIEDRLNLYGGIDIVYQKPIGAFQHPNPVTMKKALIW